MSYLVVKTSPNATPESFQLTNACNSPRLAVGSSYIPLTNTGGSSCNIRVKDNNNTYRAMEYKSSSSSSSVQETTGYSGVSSRISYYQTTLDNPSGLSSVTNLTRAETYNTVYLTAVQTTNTIYLISTSVIPITQTIQSTSGKNTSTVRGTNSCSSNNSGRYTFQLHKYTFTDNFGSFWFDATTENNARYSSSGYNGIDQVYLSYTYSRTSANLGSNFYFNMDFYAKSKTIADVNIYSSNANGNTTYATSFIKQYTSQDIQISQTHYLRAATSKSRTSQGKATISYSITTGYTGAASTMNITGTEYRTKIITTGTVYQTRASVSAYAGSSSRQSDYYTSSTDRANMSNITNLTASSSESASMMTWV